MEVEELSKKINSALQDAEVFIRDLTGEGNHFEAFVVADSFLGKSRLERHQMVMTPLKDLLNGPLHALTIKTYTREDWAKAQDI